MAFKLKTKQKPKQVVDTTPEIEAPPAKKLKAPALVDRIGELQEEEEKLNADILQDPRMKKLLSLQKERQKVEEDLRAQACTDENIGEQVLVHGTNYSAKFSPSPLKRAISDKDALVEILEGVQEGLAIQLATFGIGDLDKYLTPPQMEQVTIAERKGKRTLKIEAI